MATAKVHGLDKLTAQFSRMRDLVEKANAETLKENADDLADRIRRAAPKDEHDLESTVRVVPSRDGVSQRVVAGGRTTRKPVQDGQSPEFDYARAVEFGTEDMAAEPFFFTTYRKRKRAMRTKQNKAIKAAIKEALS